MDIKTWFAKGTVLYSEDTSIFFVREGKGVPLLCIHGFPTSSWDFASIFPELSSKFDCIVPDLPGLGISKDELSSDIIIKQSDAIELLMDELKIDQAHIFAHDIGDTVAQELLARMDDKKINRVLIIAVIVLLLLTVFNCNKSRNLRVDNNILEQNKKALSDSIRVTKNKLGEIEYSKNILVSDKKDLKDLNADLANEYLKRRVR